MSVGRRLESIPYGIGIGERKVRRIEEAPPVTTCVYLQRACGGLRLLRDWRCSPRLYLVKVEVELVAGVEGGIAGRTAVIDGTNAGVLVLCFDAQVKGEAGVRC